MGIPPWAFGPTPLASKGGAASGRAKPVPPRLLGWVCFMPRAYCLAAGGTEMTSFALQVL